MESSMYVWPDCIDCIKDMSLKVVQNLPADKEKIKYFSEKLHSHLSLDEKDWNSMTPPELIRNIWYSIKNIFGVADPLKDVKKRQNELALQLYPTLREKTLESADPLTSALRFSIAGNALDIMIGPIKKPQEKMLAELEKIPLQTGPVERLKERLEDSTKILYLGDNCGEIVLDRLFIETIKEYYNPRITFMTRTIPVLNDATKEDALFVGMDEVVPIVENGIAEPLPGTLPGKLSVEAHRLFTSSDLIIAKGGGNYDTLESEEGVKEKTVFLFQAKCRPYCAIHNTPLNSLIVFHG